MRCQFLHFGQKSQELDFFTFSAQQHNKLESMAYFMKQNEGDMEVLPGNGGVPHFSNEENETVIPDAREQRDHCSESGSGYVRLGRFYFAGHLLVFQQPYSTKAQDLSSKLPRLGGVRPQKISEYW